jgi:serine protease Do
MRKVLLIAVTILLVGSICSVSPANAGDERIGGQENIIIRIKGDANQSDGEDWLYIGSDDDDEKNAAEIKVKKKESCAAYLGIYMDEISRKIKRKYDYPMDAGVLIIDVVDESPAETAGLEEDDIIYLFDGEEVESAKHLSSLVKKNKPGDTVEIVLYRDGDRKEFDVTLGEYPYEVSIDVDDFEDYAEEIGDFAGRLGKSIGVWWHDNFGAEGRLGMELAELDEDLAEYFDVKDGDGVLVLSVREDSPAEDGGVKAGDVIVAMNGERVSEIDDILDELADPEDEAVELEIVRKGKKQKLELKMEEDELFLLQRKGKHRIVVPPKRFDVIERVEMEKEFEEMARELKELKKEFKEMKKQLEEELQED